MKSGKKLNYWGAPPNCKIKTSRLHLVIIYSTQPSNTADDQKRMNELREAHYGVVRRKKKKKKMQDAEVCSCGGEAKGE